MFADSDDAGAQAPKAERQASPEVEQVRAYIRKLRSNVLKSGSSQDIISTLRTARRDGRGGERPLVPEHGDRNHDATFYPPIQKRYKGPRDRTGWPAMWVPVRNRNRSASGPGREAKEFIAINATRIGESRVLTTALDIWRTLTARREIAPTVRESAVNALMTDISVATQHKDVPILDPQPEVSERQIEDGQYAVALGMGPRGIDAKNSDPDSRAYYLTGFLFKPKDKPAFRALLEEFAKKNIPESDRELFMRIVDNSMVMVGDAGEWNDFSARSAVGDDGFGQPVYTSMFDGSGFKRAGIVHLALALTPDGVVHRGEITADSQAAPLYFIHGKEALQRASRNHP